MISDINETEKKFGMLLIKYLIKIGLKGIFRATMVLTV